MDLLSATVSGGHMVSKSQVPLPLYQPGWYQQSPRRQLQFLSQQAVTGFPSTSPEYHWRLSGEPALLFPHSSNEVVTTSPTSMMPE
mgnify:CR=1 FL=1